MFNMLWKSIYSRCIDHLQLTSICGREALTICGKEAYAVEKHPPSAVDKHLQSRSICGQEASGLRTTDVPVEGLLAAAFV
jgi:hypothetical protein